MMWYNRLVENLILPVGDSILGASFIKKLRVWRKIQHYSKEQLEQLQKEHLKQLLSFASEKVPFYQKKQLAPKEDSYAWLKDFPIMTKKTLKEHQADLLMVPKEGLVREASSGSSGIQGEVFMSKEEEATNRAIQVLWWEWAGFKLGDPIIQTGMTRDRGLVKSVKDRLLRTHYLIAFDLNEADIKNVLDQQRKNPRKMLMGYASSLYLLAKTAADLNIDDVHFEGVVSWGDKMFNHYRKTIEEQFKTKVFDTYSCTEGFMISAQCEHGNHHIMTPQVHLELLDENLNEVAPGERGYVVVTRLDNYTMPLIRYYLGDIAVKAHPDEVCPCGRHLPMLKQIIGRDTDIVKTASGKYLIVHFFTAIFEHIPEIKQFRVVQRSLEEMEVEYIPDTGFETKHLKFAEEKIHENLQEPFPVKFIEVDHIPATKSGKPQIIQSFLPKEISL